MARPRLPTLRTGLVRAQITTPPLVGHQPGLEKKLLLPPRMDNLYFDGQFHKTLCALCEIQIQGKLQDKLIQKENLFDGNRGFGLIVTSYVAQIYKL